MNAKSQRWTACPGRWWECGLRRFHSVICVADNSAPRRCSFIRRRVQNGTSVSMGHLLQNRRDRHLSAPNSIRESGRHSILLPTLSSKRRSCSRALTVSAPSCQTALRFTCAHAAKATLPTPSRGGRAAVTARMRAPPPPEQGRWQHTWEPRREASSSNRVHRGGVPHRHRQTRDLCRARTAAVPSCRPLSRST